jgi:hypothetical protein
MSTAQGTQKIVYDGLVLYLDAWNPLSCRPGTTEWNDISGNKNHFVTVNSPTIISSRVKSIQFNGINQYATAVNAASTNQQVCPTSKTTIEIWFRMTGTPGVYPYAYGGLFGDRINQNGVLYIAPEFHPVWCWDDSYQTSQNWFNYTFSKNEWVQIVVVLEPNYFATYYVNGVLDKAKFNVGLPSNSSPCTAYWTVGRENRFGYYLASDVSIVRQYNRVLTSDEIQQNFYANRVKFGI